MLCCTGFVPKIGLPVLGRAFRKYPLLLCGAGMLGPGGIRLAPPGCRSPPANHPARTIAMVVFLHILIGICCNPLVPVLMPRATGYKCGAPCLGLSLDGWRTNILPFCKHSIVCYRSCGWGRCSSFPPWVSGCYRYNFLVLDGMAFWESRGWCCYWKNIAGQ